MVVVVVAILSGMPEQSQLAAHYAYTAPVYAYALGNKRQSGVLCGSIEVLRPEILGFGIDMNVDVVARMVEKFD